MDGWVRVLRPFNSISVILRQWKGEHERLCAMKRRLGSGRILPPAGFEPATLWSEVRSTNCSATRTLLSQISVEPYSPKGPENVKPTTLYRCMGRLFRAATRAQQQLLLSLKLSVKKDPSEIQHPQLENSRLGFIESVYGNNGRDFLGPPHGHNDSCCGL